MVESLSRKVKERGTAVEKKQWEIQEMDAARGENLAEIELSPMGERGTQEVVPYVERTTPGEVLYLGADPVKGEEKRTRGLKIGSPNSTIDRVYSREVNLYREDFPDGSSLVNGRISVDHTSKANFVLPFFGGFIIVGGVLTGSLALMFLCAIIAVLLMVYPTLLAIAEGSQLNTFVLCDASLAGRVQGILNNELGWHISEHALYDAATMNGRAELERRLISRLRSELGGGVRSVEVCYRSREFSETIPAFTAPAPQPVLEQDESKAVEVKKSSRGARISPIQRRLQGVARSGAPESAKAIASALVSLRSVNDSLSPRELDEMEHLTHEFLDIMDDFDHLRRSPFGAQEDEMARLERCFELLEKPVKRMEMEYLRQRRGKLESKANYLADKYGVGSEGKDEVA